VATAIAETSSAAAEVFDATRLLSRSADEMRQEVDEFLQKIRVA
jgi:hypothetical protein